MNHDQMEGIHTSGEGEQVAKEINEDSMIINRIGGRGRGEKLREK